MGSPDARDAHDGEAAPHRRFDVATWQRRLWRRVPRRLREPLHVLVGAAERWNRAGGPQLGAAIAFYTMFGLAPLLVVTIAIAGAVFGQEAARGQIVGQIEGLVGPVAAKAIQEMIENAWREPGGGLAAALGIGTLLVGATGAFAQLHKVLNEIGQVSAAPSSIGALVRVRLVAFALLLGLGFLAIASLVLSAALAAFTGWLSARFPVLQVVATLVDTAVSAAVLSVAFAALLRWLPDSAPSARATWIGAVSAALMFSLGKSLIGLYLGRASVSSTYGAAGSFVVLMLWIYYSAQILLFGAAIGRVHDERHCTRHRVRS